MGQSKTPSFILSLRLKTQPFQRDILEKRFEIGRKIYNACLGELLKRKKKMEHDTHFIHWIQQKKSSDRSLALSDLRKEYGLFEYSMHEWIKPMLKHFTPHIDSDTAQKIATRSWGAIKKLLFNPDTEKVHFKRFGQMESLEGKRATQGIRFIENQLVWNGLSIPVIHKKNDLYAQQSLERRVKYCHIQRKVMKGQPAFYLQLVLEGIPPVKVNKETGEIKHPIGEWSVGLDIGTQTIAISNEKDAKLIELAPSVIDIEKEKRRLLRKLDRSRRATNPNKYNENGTVKKGDKTKWVRSNRYIRTQQKLQHIQQKIADKRKQDHNQLANYILNLGNNVKVEKMNFKGLAKRSKETTINKRTGKYNRKKRFGKSIGNKAPAQLLRILKQKLSYYGLELHEVDTFKLKASQYNHIEQTCTKKILSQRWSVVDGHKVQRDLYSAFLLEHVKECGKEYDNQLLHDHFNRFLELHIKEITRLSFNDHNLSSIGVS